MATATQQKQQLKELFALWKTTSKDGKTTYFTGKTANGSNLVGFYNSKKKNPEEPDLRVSMKKEDGTNLDYASLWCKVSKAGSKYLSGQTKDKMYITGFFNNSKNEKAPYIKVYLQDALHPKQEAKEEPKKPNEAENPFNQFKTKKEDFLF